MIWNDLGTISTSTDGNLLLIRSNEDTIITIDRTEVVNLLSLLVDHYYTEIVKDDLKSQKEN